MLIHAIGFDLDLLRSDVIHKFISPLSYLSSSDTQIVIKEMFHIIIMNYYILKTMFYVVMKKSRCMNNHLIYSDQLLNQIPVCQSNCPNWTEFYNYGYSKAQTHRVNKRPIFIFKKDINNWSIINVCLKKIKTRDHRYFIIYEIIKFI